MSLIVVVAGCIVQDLNLKHQASELRADLDRRLGRMDRPWGDMHGRIAETKADTNACFTEMRSEFKDVMQAEFRAMRADMQRHHRELLARFDLTIDRVARLEQVVRR